MARLVALGRLGLVAFAALVCVMMLWWQMGNDQGVFAFVGDVVARGGLPYRDAWEVRGPLAFYFTAAINVLFGHNTWGVRLVDVGIALLTAWLLWRRLLPLTSAGTAVTAAAMWPVVVASLTYNFSAQFELWIGTALLGVTLLVTRPAGYDGRRLAAAGALVGLASLTKPFYPVFLALPGAVILLRRRSDRRGAARDVAWLVAGWSVPIAVMLAWLWHEGVLADLWNVHIMFNLRVYAPATFYTPVANSPLAARVVGLAYFLQGPLVLASIAPSAVGLTVLWRRDRPLAAAALLWVLLGIFCVLLQNKYWTYHWTPFYPALALLSAVGLHAIWPHDTGRSVLAPSGVLGVVLSAILLAAATARPFVEVRSWLRFMTGRLSEDVYYGHFADDYQINPAEERRLVRYLRAHTRPDEPFALWGPNSAVPFLADRPHTSGLLNRRIYTMLAGPTIDAYRRDYIARVDSMRPRYIVVNRRVDVGGWRQVPSATLLAAEMPALGSILARRYALEATIGGFDVFRRRDTAAPAGSPPAR